MGADRADKGARVSKLTKRVVDAAAPDPDGRRYILWDSAVTGFGLLILPTGIKSYFFNYRTAEGRERRATIGKHGAYTTDQARKRAEDMRRSVQDGHDPLGEKEELRAAPTLAELLDAYLASPKFGTKAPSTQAIDRGRIERHLKPTLGREHVRKLSPDDVRRAFRDIAAGKTAGDIKTKARGKARVRGGDGAARMAIRLLSAALVWAANEGLATANPCQHVKLGSDGTRDTILEDADGYRRLFEALARMEMEKRLRPPVADAIRVIAMTGARRGEIAGLRWEYVDLRRGALTIPPAAHKTGRRTGKPRVIALPAVARAILARQPEGEPNDYVFRPAQGAGAISLSKPWRLVRAEAGLPAEIGLHGLRHSLASHLAMSGAGAAEIMTALGHRQLATAQRYIHWAEDQRQALAEKAASVALTGMAAANPERLPGDVVPLAGNQR
jgi:integrase